MPEIIIDGLSADSSGELNQGSVEKGISGDYNFSIGAVLSEAWDKTSGTKWPIHLAFLYYFLVALAIIIVLFITTAALSFGSSSDGLAGFFQIILQIAINIILLPLMLGIIIMGIQRAAGRDINANTIFGYFSKTFSLFATMLIMSIMLAIGFLLFILPGIYLSVAYYMALPLVVEKNMGPWQALETSRKAVTRRWFRMFGFLFIMSIIVAISIIPLGIGLIWSLPLLIIAYGIIYRNMFGIEAATLK